MFALTIDSHDRLKEDLKKFVSGMLPHENSDITLYSTVLHTVLRLIPVQEMNLEYYVLFSIAEQLDVIGNQLGTPPAFTRNVLEDTLKSNLYMTIRTAKFGLGRFLKINGRAEVPKSETEIREAMGLIYTATMELYDEAFEMCLSPTEAMGMLISLRNSYIDAVGEECQKAQSYILQEEEIRDFEHEGLRDLMFKRGFYGSGQWQNFIGYIHSQLRKRLDDSDVLTDPLTTVNRAIVLRDDFLERAEPIAEYGIPPLDMRNPILKSRYTLLIGDRNVGKTTVGVNFVVNVFLAGKKVVIFSEETPESKMLYGHFLPAYIYKKYGFFVTPEQAVGIEDPTGVTIEEATERKRLVNRAISEVAESGRYLYIDEFNAWESYERLCEIESSFDFDYIMLDHTLSMSGGGNSTERLGVMSSGIRKFRQKHKKSILLLSHQSSDASKVFKNKSKNSQSGESPLLSNDVTGLAAYCKQIEADADEILFLFTRQSLEARSLLAMLQTKARDATKVSDIIYLTKMFEYKLIRYDTQAQISSGRADISNILEVMGEESYDDDEDEDDDDDF